ncbi:MAG: hypothetical protein WBC44_05055 [Planctomycetaceae bacterium]
MSIVWAAVEAGMALSGKTRGTGQPTCLEYAGQGDASAEKPGFFEEAGLLFTDRNRAVLFTADRLRFCGLSV